MFYTLDNNNYREFLMLLLNSMKPLRLERGEIIFDHQTEVNEVDFIEQGNVDIGFAVNRGKKFALRLFDSSVLGAFNCQNNSKTMFVYRAQSDIKGYFVTKDVWKQLVEDFDDISIYVSGQTEMFYMQKIRKPLL